MKYIVTSYFPMNINLVRIYLNKDRVKNMTRLILRNLPQN